MSRVRLRFAALLLTVGAAGCGGDGTGMETPVRATTEDFVRSIHARDYRRVCSLVTQDVRTDWEAFARRHPGPADCPSFAAEFYRHPRGTLQGSLAEIDRATVRVDGQTATLIPHPDDRQRGRDGTTRLRHVGNRWLLTD